MSYEPTVKNNLTRFYYSFFFLPFNLSLSLDFKKRKKKSGNVRKGWTESLSGRSCVLYGWGIIKFIIPNLCKIKTCLIIVFLKKIISEIQVWQKNKNVLVKQNKKKTGFGGLSI